MTEKEVRKLKRSELMELLLEVSKENEELKVKIEELEKKVSSRKIAITESGSIAEASLKLNGVFEAAEKAAQQYLENIKKLYDNPDVVAEKIQLEANQKATEIINRANKYDRAVRARADKYSKRVSTKIEKLRQNSDGYKMGLQAKRTQER